MRIKYKVEGNLFYQFWDEYTLPMAADHYGPYGMSEWISKIRVPYAAACTEVISDDRSGECYFEIDFKEEKDLTLFLLTL